MSTSESKTLDKPSQPLDRPMPIDSKSPAEEAQKPHEDSNPPAEELAGEVGDENEEEGECGFCLIMKAGGCRESFVAWEKCMAEAERTGEDKCSEIIIALTKCMKAHSDYYQPILGVEAEVIEELEKENGSAPKEAAISGDK